MKFNIILGSVLLISLNIFAQNTETLWIAKGLQAANNIEMLQSAYSTNPTKKIKYKLLIEKAYANIANNPKKYIIRDYSSYRFILSYDFGSSGILEVVYVVWDDEIPNQGTAFLKIKSIPKNYSTVIDSKGNIDIYFDNGKKYYRVLVFPFNNGLDVYTN
jgi:hypothetical protein